MVSYKFKIQFSASECNSKFVATCRIREVIGVEIGLHYPPRRGKVIHNAFLRLNFTVSGSTQEGIDE